MDDARERELLLGRARTQVTRRMTERWRLGAYETDFEIPTHDLPRALGIVAGSGRIVEQEDGSLAVMRRTGWIGMSRVLVECSYPGSAATTKLHLRGVSMERRAPKRILRKIRRRITGERRRRPRMRLPGLPSG